MTDKGNGMKVLPPRDSNPDMLIQSQLVKITGPVERVREVLFLLQFDAPYHKVTVTITPTSVPDATVGVTQDSQQNPRHTLTLEQERDLSLHAEVYGFGSALKEYLGSSKKSDYCPRCRLFREHMPGTCLECGTALIAASPDVTEQSQQKSRKDQEEEG